MYAYWMNGKFLLDTETAEEDEALDLLVRSLKLAIPADYGAVRVTASASTTPRSTDRSDCATDSPSRVPQSRAAPPE